MRPTIMMLGLIAGCPSPEPPETPPDSETDATDLPTADSAGITFETSWPQDTTLQPPDTHRADSAVAPGPADSAVCPWGEVPDCNTVCFPRYFLGDGHCDDGSRFDADFDCVGNNYDEGDCFSIDTSQPECHYLLRVPTDRVPSDYSWDLLDANGIAVYTSLLNAYGDNFRTYEHNLDLRAGDYTFLARDLEGNGWDNGAWEIIDPTTGALLVSDSFTEGDEQLKDFTITCDGTQAPPACELDTTFFTTADGAEMGWEVVTPSNYVVVRRIQGAFAPDTVTTESLLLPEGQWKLRMRDSGNDGWEGGHIEMRQPDGRLVGIDSLARGAQGAFLFSLDCSGTHQALPEPGPLEIPCEGLNLRVDAATDGREVGLRVYDAGWTPIVNRDPGFAQPFTVVDIPLALASGRYFLQLRDGNGDGWLGSNLSLIQADGTNLLTYELDGGWMDGVYLDITCTDEITEDTGDTGTIPDGPCVAGATEDCQGICWPTVYVGDGLCDDGIDFAPDFACPELSFDQGDCTTSVP